MNMRLEIKGALDRLWWAIEGINDARKPDITRIHTEIETLEKELEQAKLAMVELAKHGCPLCSIDDAPLFPCSEKPLVIGENRINNDIAKAMKKAKEKPCPACNGRGVIPYEDDYGRGERTCSKCMGRKTVEELRTPEETL